MDSLANTVVERKAKDEREKFVNANLGCSLIEKNVFR